MLYFRSFLFRIALWVVSILFIIISFFCALYIRIFLNKIRDKPRIVWGSDPIINNSYWSKSMQQIGYTSETFTTDFYSTINKRSDWGIIISEKYKYILYPLKPFLPLLKVYLNMIYSLYHLMAFL
jgi:hypothetical protein